MFDAIGEPFDESAVQSGDMTPVFFGSAINNFGIQLLLDSFLDYAPPPRPRLSKELLIPPEDPRFSGFIFKIQSNMDPKHRDQIAFVRICSGRFVRDMKVFHSRTGKSLRLSNSQKMFAKERETVDEAFPGDVIGLVGHADFGIGDTLAEDPLIVYDELPQFAPENFAFLHNPSPSQFKRFRAGLDHLLQEGAIQVFNLKNTAQRVPLLGAVGPLQFEVLQYRLETEYGAISRLEAAPWTLIRWVEEEYPGTIELHEENFPSECRLASDEHGRTVIVSTSEWGIKFFCDRHPDVRLLKLPSRIHAVR
jgi:peptide chain release factor 3